MSGPVQMDWLSDASFSRVVTHPPERERPLEWLAQDGERALARRTDPETSHAAAARATDFKDAHERLITAWLRAHPLGGTKNEIAAGTGLDATAVARRMHELCEAAGVYDSGETRPTPTGRAATVWRIR